jgi:uncharacterized spore protein YtfJ
MNEQDLRADLREEVEASGVLDRLAESVGLASRASAVFADPVEMDGITVIPVARSRWGFGGGGGENADGQGSGGGGAGTVAPLGYIEIRNGQAEFRRIGDRRWLVLGGAAVAAVALARRRPGDEGP